MRKPSAWLVGTCRVRGHHVVEMDVLHAGGGMSEMKDRESFYVWVD